MFFCLHGERIAFLKQMVLGGARNVLSSQDPGCSPSLARPLLRSDTLLSRWRELSPRNAEMESDNAESLSTESSSAPARPYLLLDAFEKDFKEQTSSNDAEFRFGVMQVPKAPLLDDVLDRMFTISTSEMVEPVQVPGMPPEREGASVARWMILDKVKVFVREVQEPKIPDFRNTGIGT